jgi:uncharacterized phage protein gp47/JayE
MGEIIDGRFVSDQELAILDALMEDAKNQFGEDLNDSDEAVIRLFYLPVARRFAEAQNNIGLVLDSAQIEHATGTALDFLTALIGVPREDADKATGEVEVSIDSADSVDHIVPKGTTVSTNSSDPVVFETTDSRTLSAGNTSVTAPIRAVTGGSDSNVGQNTLVNFPDGVPFPGASVTNPTGTDGGSDTETDEDLRDRAQDELANGARATGPALISRTQALDGVFDVTIFINDTPEQNGRGYGLPAHSFELVLATDGEDDTLQRVAQRLIETKAVGDVSVTGNNGDQLDTSKSFVTANGEIETTLPNDQTHPVGFSLSSSVYTWVNVDIKVDDEYEGDDVVRNSIVEYIGGLKTTGLEQDGELSVSDDVIHAEVEAAVMEVDGVYDINAVTIGKDSSSTDESNISLATHEQAVTDATSGNQHISLTTTSV